MSLCVAPSVSTLGLGQAPWEVGRKFQDSRWGAGRFIVRGWGISMEIQRLRLRAPNAGATVSIPGGDLRSRMPRGAAKNKIII